jgi:hypothetical protein
MAVQDDIMSVLSGVGSAGDRATNRGRRGEELYANISSILGDNPNYRKALRELTGLGSRPDMTLEEEMSMDPILGGKVADIIEKYMVDAETVGEVPDDMIVDDTDAAERMLETAGMAPREAVSIEELPAAAPRQAVTREPLPEVARPDLDETARESLIREMDEGLSGLLAGTPEYGISTPTPIQTGGDRGEFAGTPGTSIAPARVSDGRIPLKERLFAGQEAAGGPMSAGEQAAFMAGMFIPVGAIPAIGRILGISASQIRNFVRAGDKGSEALGQLLQQRAKFLSADELAEIRQIFRASELGQRAKPTAPMRSNGRFAGTKDIGPFQMTPTEQLSRQAQQFRQGLSQPAFKQGGNIRDKIMKTYGGM